MKIREYINKPVDRYSVKRADPYRSFMYSRYAGSFLRKGLAFPEYGLDVWKDRFTVFI